MGDIISHLTLVLGHLARAVPSTATIVEPTGPTHPAVVQAGCGCWTRSSPIRGRWASGRPAAPLPRLPAAAVQVVHQEPPMTYLARWRVETAAGLLLHTDQSVTQIGRSVGWPDQLLPPPLQGTLRLGATTYRSRFADRTRRLQTYGTTVTVVGRRPVLSYHRFISCYQRLRASGHDTSRRSFLDVDLADGAVMWQSGHTSRPCASWTANWWAGPLSSSRTSEPPSARQATSSWRSQKDSCATTS